MHMHMTLRNLLDDLCDALDLPHYHMLYEAREAVFAHIKLLRDTLNQINPLPSNAYVSETEGMRFDWSNEGGWVASQKETGDVLGPISTEHVYITLKNDPSAREAD